MNTLYAYVITPSVAETFERNQAFQERLYPDAVRGANKLEIHADDEGEMFCHAKWNNQALEHATNDRRVEWLVIPDVDAIMLNPITQWPETGFGLVKTRFLKSGESIDPLPPFDPIGSHHPFEFMVCSWFILRRDAFERCRECEDFFGHGYQDWDFMETLHLAGFPRSRNNARALHIPHPPRSSMGRREINKSMYFKRTGLECPRAWGWDAE